MACSFSTLTHRLTEEQRGKVSEAPCVNPALLPQPAVAGCYQGVILDLLHLCKGALLLPTLSLSSVSFLCFLGVDSQEGQCDQRPQKQHTRSDQRLQGWHPADEATRRKKAKRGAASLPGQVCQATAGHSAARSSTQCTCTGASSIRAGSQKGKQEESSRTGDLKPFVVLSGLAAASNYLVPASSWQDAHAVCQSIPALSSCSADSSGKQPCSNSREVACSQVFLLPAQLAPKTPFYSTVTPHAREVVV